MKNNDEKNNSIVQNELKNKLLSCNNSIEFEKVIKQMYFKNMNVQKYITTAVYRILILNKHDYKGYERIARHYGVYYQNQAKYIKKSNKKKSKCTGDSRYRIISDIKNFDTFKKHNSVDKEENMFHNFSKIEKISENTTPNRKTIKIKKIVRSQKLVYKLKIIYRNRCQVCGDRIDIGYGKYYSEVHHIQPLGYHEGPDILDNMIVLCPNHHLLFDKGVITINLKERKIVHYDKNNVLNTKNLIIKHNINEKYINYHNKNVFIGFKDNKDIKSSDTITWGAIVILQDIETNEKFELKLEEWYQKEFMNNLGKKLINKQLNDIVRFNEFSYKIVDISYDNNKI